MGVRLRRRGMTRSKRGQGTSEERGALDWHWTQPPQSAHLCLPNTHYQPTKATQSKTRRHGPARHGHTRRTHESLRKHARTATVGRGPESSVVRPTASSLPPPLSTSTCHDRTRPWTGLALLLTNASHSNPFLLFVSPRLLPIPSRPIHTLVHPSLLPSFLSCFECRNQKILYLHPSHTTTANTTNNARTSIAISPFPPVPCRPTLHRTPRLQPYRFLHSKVLVRRQHINANLDTATCSFVVGRIAALVRASLHTR
jgi:hypothetical protein